MIARCHRAAALGMLTTASVLTHADEGTLRTVSLQPPSLMHAAPEAVPADATERLRYALWNQDGPLVEATSPSPAAAALAANAAAWRSVVDVADRALGPGQVFAALPVPPSYPAQLVLDQIHAAGAPRSPDLALALQRGAASRPIDELARETAFLERLASRLERPPRLAVPAVRRLFRDAGLAPTFWWWFDQPEDATESGPNDAVPVGAAEPVLVRRPAHAWSYIVRNHRTLFPRPDGGVIDLRWIVRLPVDASGNPAPPTGACVVAFPYQGDRGGTFNSIALHNLTTRFGIVTAGFLVAEYPEAGGQDYGLPAEVLDAWIAERLRECGATRVAVWGLSRGCWEAMNHAARQSHVGLAIGFLSSGAAPPEDLRHCAVVMLNTEGSGDSRAAAVWAGRLRAAGAIALQASSRPIWGDRRPGTGFGTRHAADELTWVVATEFTRFWAEQPQEWARWADAARGDAAPRLPGNTLPWLWAQFPKPARSQRAGVPVVEAAPPFESLGLVAILHGNELDPAVYRVEDAAAFATARRWSALVVRGDGPEVAAALVEQTAPARSPPRRSLVSFLPIPPEGLAIPPGTAAFAVLNPSRAWMQLAQSLPASARKLAVFTRNRHGAARAFTSAGGWEVWNLDVEAGDPQPGYLEMLAWAVRTEGRTP